jgi:DNA mismatch endonuclease (patch repair protein)
MSRIRKTDTNPELLVRRILHNLGYRFRLYRKDLPGCPDIVLPAHRKIIFIHGCWWHRHNCHLGRRKPKSKTGYWLPKLEANKKRDKENRRKLRGLGWKVLVIWECQIKKENQLINRITNFLKTNPR